MGDYYTEDPSRLLGQPKRTIGDYVEQNGILVPRRYGTLEEARKSKKGVLLRSEHIQEYDGVSGLLNSFALSTKLSLGYCIKPKPGEIFSPKGAKSIEEIKERYFALGEYRRRVPDHEKYCKMLGLDLEHFKEEITFSLWEKLGGFNRTVVADSAVKGRYHISTVFTGCPEYSNHILWDNENVLHQEGDPLHTELLESIPELIDFYEEVRHLDKFDPNHCPIIEIQTVNEKNYFLQYHRTRNFSAVDFKLDRELEKGEYEVDFVRGAIYPTVCKVVLANWQDCIPTSLKEEDTISPENWKIPEIEEGDLYTHNYDLYHEIMLPKRTLQMIDHRPDIDLNIFNSMLADHFSRSLVFKPAVTVAYSEEIGFYTKTEFTEARLRASKQKESQHIDISIESDGRKAYVKRVA